MDFSLPAGSVPTTELLVCAAVFVVLFAIAYWFGSVRVIALALSVILGSALASKIPDAALVGSLVQTLALKSYGALALLVTLIVFSFLILGRMIGADNAPVHKPLDAILASVSGTAFFMAIWMATAPFMALWQPAATFGHVFGTPYTFWWLIGTLIALSISRSRGFF